MNISTSFAATVLLSVSLNSMALAQSSASASISAITFQLIDLDLADGIAPSLSFISDIPYGESNGGWEIYDNHTGLLLNQEAKGAAPLGPFRVSRSYVDEPHMRSEVSAGISGAALADKSAWASASMLDRLGENTSIAWVRSGFVAFVLSPNTSVTFTADVSLLAEAGPVAGPGLWAAAIAGASMGMRGEHDSDWVSASLYHNAVFGEDRGAGREDSFSISRANTLHTSDSYVLNFQASASAYTTPAIPPPVPEPATYAMLLAGIGIVAMRRRFKH